MRDVDREADEIAVRADKAAGLACGRQLTGTTPGARELRRSESGTGGADNVDGVGRAERAEVIPAVVVDVVEEVVGLIEIKRDGVDVRGNLSGREKVTASSRCDDGIPREAFGQRSRAIGTDGCHQAGRRTVSELG